MFDKVQVFQGENPDVWKYVFEKEDACVEAVLYRYGSFEKRTVMCISVQSGCPVGCVFCGTGRSFIRNLTAEEIVAQAERIVSDVEIQTYPFTLNSISEKFQIMFMSMGEPMLNWDNVNQAIMTLHQEYRNADLLVSTVGLNKPEVAKSMIQTSMAIPKVGLQFSVHSGFDARRNGIIPFAGKLDLRQIRDFGMDWNNGTWRPVYLNICVDQYNMGAEEIKRLKDLFSPLVFNLTFSVICEYENGQVKDPAEKALVEEKILGIMQDFLKDGYNVRKFDPAGQDDIGAGCGQLWYVQEWMKERKRC